MTAIAAVAIAEKYSASQPASAGLFVVAVISFLSIAGLMQWFTRVIRVPIVKRIQVGTGVSLMMSAANFFPNLDVIRHWDDYLTLLVVLVFLFSVPCIRGYRSCWL